MKILIVGLAKIKYMPYLNFYLDSLNNKNEIHVAYWNRDGKKEDLSNFSNIFFHEYVYEQFNSVSKFLKLRPYHLYKRFVYDVCKREKFDFIIFLHSLAGLVVKKYLKTGRYIFDYRDTSLESYPFYKRMIRRWARKSYVTFVSSEGFLKYLPKTQNIKLTHNLVLEDLKHRDYIKTESKKIRIAFWGYIRNVGINIKMIDSLRDDSRFELHYYGREQDDALILKDYCKANRISNVFFHGEYSPADRYSFVRTTDLIHNVYFDKNTLIAMGNKYYDGVLFRIPQLCYKGSLMGKKVSEFGIGLTLDFEKDKIADSIYRYYKTINMEAFCLNCDSVLSRILDEYENGVKIVADL